MNKKKLYDFVAASDLVSKGRLMARKIWEQGTFIGMRTPVNEFINVPYVYMSTFRVKGIPMAKRKILPWTPSQDDLFAEDWFIIDEDDDMPVSAVPAPPPHRNHKENFKWNWLYLDKYKGKYGTTITSN